jgi:hypothetical protein
MNWIKNRKWLVVGVIVIPIIVTFSIVYAVHENAKPYKNIIVKNPLCTYSLTYPTYLKKDGPYYDEKPPPPGTLLYLNFERKTVSNGDYSWTYSPGGITFDVYKPEIPPTSAEEKVNSTLSSHSEKRDEFKIIEKKPVSIGGVKGYEAVYTYKHLIKAVGYKTERIIYLIRGELVWDIELTCDTDLFEIFNTDFEYILQSFKFLD